MRVILWHIDKRWQALAEPHGNVSVHVDSKRLKALLEAAHGIKLEGTGIRPEIHAADLRQSQRADGHKACGMGKDSPASARSAIREAARKPNLCFRNSFESRSERWDTILRLSSWHLNSTTGAMWRLWLYLMYEKEKELRSKESGEKNNHPAKIILKL